MRRTAFLAATLVMLLGGCKVDSRHEVFLSDIVDAAEGKADAAFANGTIKVEMPSDKACRDNSQALSGILSKYYKGVAGVACTKSGMDNFLEFSTKSPVVAGKVGAPALVPEGSIGGFSAFRMEHGIMVAAMVDRRRLASLEKELADVFKNSVKLE